MRNTRVAGQALSLAAGSTRQPYVCRACLAQATRQLSTTNPRNAQEPFYKRLQDSLFGSKASKAAEKSRDDARQKQLEEIKEGGSDRPLEKVETPNGAVYEIADIVDPTTHSDYIVSRSWTGLDVVGSEKWVKERADQGEQYTGFLPQQQANLTSSDWAALLHTVAAEVLTLRKAGRDVLQVCNARVLNADSESESRTSGIAVSNEQGSFELQFASSEQEQAILNSIPEQQERSWRGAVDAELLQAELLEALSSEGSLFLALTVEDPSIKFAILKRTMQLTGKRIPDRAISNAKTLGELHIAFAAKEAPKKLYETEALENLNDAPNVQVHKSRQTHVHKDKAIGRWKLIEEELEIRNMLPNSVNKAA